MKPLAAKILEYAAGLPEGATLRAKELLHLGSRAGVDQALSRLERSGEILRITRGVYMRPVQGRYGPRTPSASAIVEAISHATGETIASHGAVAANILGLSTQVPMRPIYLTSGRSRSLKLGSQTVELRHAPDWQLLMPGEAAGDVVRALSWAGAKQAHRSLKTLRKRLPHEELRSLTALRGRLPTWLAQEVASLAYA